MTRCSNSTSNSRACVASGNIPSDNVSRALPKLLKPQKSRKLFFNEYLDTKHPNALYHRRDRKDEHFSHDRADSPLAVSCCVGQTILYEYALSTGIVPARLLLLCVPGYRNSSRHSDAGHLDWSANSHLD